jgi:hypothetical protein
MFVTLENDNEKIQFWVKNDVAIEDLRKKNKFIIIVNVIDDSAEIL